MLSPFRLSKKMEYVLSVCLYNNFKCTVNQTHYLLTTGTDNPSIMGLYYYFYSTRWSADSPNNV